VSSDRRGLSSSVPQPRLVLGPEPPRTRARDPSVESIIWKELRAFRDGGGHYSELRARWLTEFDRDQSVAVEALAQAIGGRVGISVAIVRPLLAALIIRF
jgi:hypothetical protein